MGDSVPGSLSGDRVASRSRLDFNDSVMDTDGVHCSAEVGSSLTVTSVSPDTETNCRSGVDDSFTCSASGNKEGSSWRSQVSDSVPVSGDKVGSKCRPRVCGSISVSTLGDTSDCRPEVNDNVPDSEEGDKVANNGALQCVSDSEEGDCNNGLLYMGDSARKSAGDKSV
jgi:hypothetical protein